MSDGMNPYKVLMLDPTNLSMRKLNGNFEKLVAQLHPSKCQLPRSSAEDVQKMLVNCYQMVLDDIRQNDQRSAAATGPRTKHMGADLRMSDSEAKRAAKKFDMSRFNEVYDKNRTPTIYDKGYKDWLSGNFDDNAPKSCDEYNSLQEPEPVNYFRGKGVGFSEIGAQDVSNFGNATDYGSKSCMKYYDIRDAHSCRNNLIDSRLESGFKQKERTYEDILAERARADSLLLSPAQAKAIQEQRAEQEREDVARERLLAEQMKRAAEQFDRTHEKMFGRKGGGGGGSSSSGYHQEGHHQRGHRHIKHRHRQ